MKGLPAFEQLQRQFTRRVTVINLSFEPMSRVRRYLARHPMSTVHAWTPKARLPEVFQSATRLKPVTFVIDKTGRVRTTLFGKKDGAELAREVRKLL